MDYSAMSPYEVRKLIREEKITGQTSGMCAGYAQANLAVLPKEYAYDFLLFTQRNPKTCPILEVSDVGSMYLKKIAKDCNIASDIPKYRVYENGVMTGEYTNVEKLWRDDLVAFLIGCSFSFESELLESGVSVRHIEEGRNVPMYMTNIECEPAGTPIHIGDPAAIGIKDINKPDFGDSVTIKEGEMPVFWACGVTPQSIVMNTKPSFCITHAPGHMLITDVKNCDLKF